MGYQRDLIKSYEKVEKTFNIIDSTQKYCNLVRANGNLFHPIQRWFRFKEGFSVDLMPNLINEWSIDVNGLWNILDPFCGVGTSFLSCQKIAKQFNLKNLYFLGFERNPFLHFVANTKFQWSKYDIQEFRNLTLEHFDIHPELGNISIPDLSTLHRDEVFTPYQMRKLLSIREGILDGNSARLEKKVLFLGYASILEGVSGVRKDGRALRIVPSKKKAPINRALRHAYNMIAQDLAVAEQVYQEIDGEILLGDGRNLVSDDNHKRARRSFDLIFYSPPYLNNIDYSEVYKLELWMCNFMQSQKEFKSLRRKTFRSHPSIKFEQPIVYSDDLRMEKACNTLDSLISALPTDKNVKWRTTLFKGYFDDMYISLRKQFEVLKPGGWVFCIVGNSLHGPNGRPQFRVPAAVDIITALIAEGLGYKVRAIQVARNLIRRKPMSKYLRESILVLQKPL